MILNIKFMKCINNKLNQIFNFQSWSWKYRCRFLFWARTSQKKWSAKEQVSGAYIEGIEWCNVDVTEIHDVIKVKVKEKPVW